MTASYETIRTRLDGTVLSATFDAPPMNLIGPRSYGTWSHCWRNCHARPPHAW